MYTSPNRKWPHVSVAFSSRVHLSYLHALCLAATGWSLPLDTSDGSDWLLLWTSWSRVCSGNWLPHVSTSAPPPRVGSIHFPCLPVADALLRTHISRRACPNPSCAVPGVAAVGGGGRARSPSNASAVSVASATSAAGGVALPSCKHELRDVAFVLHELRQYRVSLLYTACLVRLLRRKLSAIQCVYSKLCSVCYCALRCYSVHSFPYWYLSLRTPL